jgi:hypothetical protein
MAIVVFLSQNNNNVWRVYLVYCSQVKILEIFSSVPDDPQQVSS